MIHKTIKKVTEDAERFHLNTAIASIMELVNAIYKFIEVERKDGELQLLKGVIEHLIVLLSPFCPHITEELWEARKRGSCHRPRHGRHTTRLTSRKKE